MGGNRFLSRISSLSSQPIRLEEFSVSLLKVLGAHHGPRPRTIGLAISGGVDSMTLASLCAQLQAATRQSSLAGSHHPISGSTSEYLFRAFVVDHGVRKGSKEEAHSVSKLLGDQGIPTKVLQIHWDGAYRPTVMSNFESVARKLRFRALGRACDESGINSLLLAHHQDDQAETVLMRLISGHRGRGLAGIRGSSGIPECYGIHDVHESGGFDRTGQQADHHGNITINSTFCHTAQYRQLPVEYGGICIYRPLLGFSKARLEATAEAQGIKWFEDNTNKDPTLTTRNAIRHMYNGHAMPTALSKHALLGLATNFEHQAAVLTASASTWLAGATATKLDTRIGTVRIGFRKPDHSDMSSHNGHNLHETATYALRRLVTLVSPHEHVKLSSLRDVVTRAFPGILEQDEGNDRRLEGFTVSGVQFTPWPHKKQGILTHIQSNNQDAERCEWIVSRQPYTSDSTQVPLLVIPGGQQLDRPNWSPWSLFDGRFWIRTQWLGAKPLQVRPFRIDNLKNFKSGLTTSTRRVLLSFLKEHTPGGMRWTIPAISTEDEDGNDKVLCLPTLGIGRDDSIGQLRWEVRYKKVDLRGINLM